MFAALAEQLAPLARLEIDQYFISIVGCAPDAKLTVVACSVTPEQLVAVAAPVAIEQPVLVVGGEAMLGIGEAARDLHRAVATADAAAGRIMVLVDTEAEMHAAAAPLHL